MFEQTVERLLPLFPYPRLWTVTNAEQAGAVRKLTPRFRAAQVLAEPTGRNTAAAIALAAFHLVRQDADALMAVLPADHFIADGKRYRSIVRAALQVAARGPNLVVLGIPPAHPETGYGYIERGDSVEPPFGVAPSQVFRVRRFTEKPRQEVAREFVASGNYYWNAGMFFWRAATYLDCLRRFLPATHVALSRVAETIGTRRYSSTLARAYPQLENISVDYAILERATREPGGGNVFVLPAEVGWSDIGSWASVYELMAGAKGANVSSAPLCAFDSAGNYVWSAEKLVALLGVNDLVVVETPDALLVCPRSRAQEVAKIVKWLEERKQKVLL